MWKNEVKTVKEGFRVAALELVQLRELRKLEQEERALFEDDIGAQVPGHLKKEREKIEKKLRALQMVQEELQQPDQETLVTRSVPLEEVKKGLKEWTPALEAEYRSLLTHKAIVPIDEREYQQIREECKVVESIPGMLVATLTAFLQAPRKGLPGRETVVQPPTILKEAGILKYGWSERWKITGALYGLVESPRDWADFRDRKLREMRCGSFRMDRKFNCGLQRNRISGSLWRRQRTGTRRKRR